MAGGGGSPWTRGDGTVDWRVRDRALLAILDDHSLTISQTVQLGFFDAYKTAWQRFDAINRKKRGKKARMVGVVQLHDEGHTTNVYCNGYEPKNLLHDVHVTHVLIPFIRAGAEIKRGPRCDPDLRPDATLILDNEIHIEVDMGTCNRQDILSRMRNFEGEFVVWIAPTVERMRWLHGLAEAVQDTVLFSTFCWCWHLWWDYLSECREVKQEPAPRPPVKLKHLVLRNRA